MAGPNQIDRDRFIEMLADRFPVVLEEMDASCEGLLHPEMSTLARAAQAAISDEDVQSVRAHFSFIDEVFRQATPEVKNAINVSFLECISFTGRHGKRINARQLLSPILQQELIALEAYLAKIYGDSKQ